LIRRLVNLFKQPFKLGVSSEEEMEPLFHPVSVGIAEGGSSAPKEGKTFKNRDGQSCVYKGFGTGQSSESAAGNAYPISHLLPF
jgi:hypothetical protein